MKFLLFEDLCKIPGFSISNLRVFAGIVGINEGFWSGVKGICSRFVFGLIAPLRGLLLVIRSITVFTKEFVAFTKELLFVGPLVLLHIMAMIHQ